MFTRISESQQQLSDKRWRIRGYKPRVISLELSVGMGQLYVETRTNCMPEPEGK